MKKSNNDYFCVKIKYNVHKIHMERKSKLKNRPFVKTLNFGNNKKGHKIVDFTERILSADIIRKAETAHRPVVAYKPLDSNEKMAMEKCQKQWLSLVREIIDRI